MYFAALGGIHGNLPALEAILDALEREGVYTAVFTGNFVGALPWVNEVIERIKTSRVAPVRGEWDRLAAVFARKGERLRGRLPAEILSALEEAQRRCTVENLEYLRGLPALRRLRVEGLDIVVCHGSPSNPRNALEPGAKPARFARERELANADIIVCGGGSAVFDRFESGALFVNPGPAGLVDNTGKAPYVIVDTETRPWQVRRFTAPYDPERVRPYKL